jgi:hypothetical protein
MFSSRLNLCILNSSLEIALMVDFPGLSAEEPSLSRFAPIMYRSNEELFHVVYMICFLVILLSYDEKKKTSMEVFVLYPDSRLSESRVFFAAATQQQCLCYLGGKE